MSRVDFDSVEKLMEWLREQGYDVPLETHFPVGSTARALYRLPVKDQNDPAFKHLWQVEGKWNPLTDSSACAWASVWVALPPGAVVAEPTTSLGRKIMAFVKRAGMRLISPVLNRKGIEK